MVIEARAEAFVCACCGRDKPIRFLAKNELVDTHGKAEPLCKQCDGFINVGLSHLTSRLRKAGLKVVLRNSSFPPGHADSVGKAQKAQKTERAASPKAETPTTRRMASATERDAFAYRSLAFERYIEGFIKGLESGGLDRDKLDAETTVAVNNLLSIRQKLSSERLKVTTGDPPRAHVRKVSRHLDETGMMVEEYVRAVTEALSRTGKRDIPSKSPGR